MMAGRLQYILHWNYNANAVSLHLSATVLTALCRLNYRRTYGNVNYNEHIL